MKHVKVIKSEQAHKQAMERLLALMNAEPVSGSLEADEIELLGFLIERYEKSKYPIAPPDPIEAICFRMEQQGLRQKDLVPYIGSISKVSEVLNGSRNLSISMIRKLSQGLGISADVLIREPVQQTASNGKIDSDKFPLAVMRKRGYFEKFTGSLTEFKADAAEILIQFLSSVPNGMSLQPTMLRTSANNSLDIYALWAWQVRVLQKAQKKRLSTNYKQGTVTLPWMRQLARLSWSEQGPLLAREYLNQHGIHLIFEQHLPKTYLDGAVCLTHTGHPVVVMTLRYDRLDNFWFTLLHELAHISLHINEVKNWIIEDLDDKSKNQKEKEADELAENALIDYPNILTLERNANTIRELATRLTISPCIIAGRLRKNDNNHALFGKLFRDKAMRDILFE